MNRDPAIIREDILRGNFQSVEIALSTMGETKENYLLQAELYHGRGEFQNQYLYAKKLIDEFDDYTPTQFLSANYWMAWSRFRLGDLAEAYSIVIRALSYIESLSDDDQVVVSREHGLLQNVIGSYYLELGNYTEGINYLNKSRELIENSNDMAALATYHNNYAYAHQINGELERATEEYFKSLNILENFDYSSLKAMVLSNLGEVYRIKGVFDQAYSYHKEALDIRFTLMNQQSLAVQLRYMGSLFLEMEEYEEAENYINQSLELWVDLNNPLWYSASLFDHCRLLLHKGEKIDEPLSKIFNLYETSENKIIHSRYLLLNAMVLKQSPRMINKSEAQKLLRSIFEGAKYDFEISYLALIEYLKLLFEEIRLSYHSEIIEEAIEITNLISKISQENHVYQKQVEVYIYQSLLNQLKGDFNRAMAFLEQAELLVFEHNLEGLKIKVEQAKNKFSSNKERLLDNNLTLLEVIEIIDIENSF